jgi:hypothetical protein
MPLDSIIGFVKPELFILIVFLWCLGLFLKKAPWFSSDWCIPFILLGASFFITIAYMAVVMKEGFNGAVIINGTVQSVIIASLTVFGNEIIKQITKKRIKDKRGW